MTSLVCKIQLRFDQDQILHVLLFDFKLGIQILKEFNFAFKLFSQIIIFSHKAPDFCAHLFHSFFSSTESIIDHLPPFLGFLLNLETIFDFLFQLHHFITACLKLLHFLLPPHLFLLKTLFCLCILFFYSLYHHFEFTQLDQVPFLLSSPLLPLILPSLPLLLQLFPLILPVPSLLLPVPSLILPVPSLLLPPLPLHLP